MQNHPSAMWQRRHERRGWVTTAIAAIPAVTSVISPTNQQDAARFQTAQDAYRLALQGDKDAQCQLKHLTGRYGCATCGRFGQTCGFATQAAKDYCATLYNQFVQQQSGILSPDAPIPTPPSGSTPTPVTITATTGSPSGSGVTIQAGSAPPPTVSQQRTTMLNTALIAALVVGGAVLFWFSRRRG